MNSPRGGLLLERYRTKKFVDLSLDELFFPTGVNVLLGKNGIGKTTLLRSLTDGRLREEGARLTLVSPAARRPLSLRDVASLPQAPKLPTNLSVEDLLTYCMHIRGAPRGDLSAALNGFGLQSVAGKLPKHLSGGEKQRLNLALVFVGRPRVLLLDEPTTALDPPGRLEFAQVLGDHAAKSSVVVVMSTHLASDVPYADLVFLLAGNRVAWIGKPDDFLAASPRADFDNAFMRRTELAAPR